MWVLQTLCRPNKTHRGLEPRFQLPASELLQEQGVPIKVLGTAQGPAPELWGEMWLESDLRI